ncbi:hypothetical protein F4554_003732 [Actinopolymorpha rutila]|uniref:Uncharacterized protein n=1 Tax=Actinopolymorpha rutila TaxID=446787 RepID=A0A852ZDW5_9ACTN|nr:hypothetical protein [Actinopolymorpha rutila]
MSAVGNLNVQAVRGHRTVHRRGPHAAAKAG